MPLGFTLSRNEFTSSLSWWLNLIYDSNDKY